MPTLANFAFLSNKAFSSRYVSTAVGQQLFTTNTNWTVPVGVTSISAVVVGGGGGGFTGLATNPFVGTGGGGGGLAYLNNIAVTPGESLTITVGIGGANTAAGVNAVSGGSSSIKRGATSLVEASGGQGGIANNFALSAQGGSNVVGFGATGGRGLYVNSGSSGGGGAAGYSGNGGDGEAAGTGGTVPGTAGSGGGGGGGGRTDLATGASGGGGVGLLGEGSSGASSSVGSVGGGGGSGGANGGIFSGSGNINGGAGGLYGGGAGASENVAGAFGGIGANGAVRIIWGVGRAFPNTNTTDI